MRLRAAAAAAAAARRRGNYFRLGKKPLRRKYHIPSHSSHRPILHALASPRSRRNDETRGGPRSVNVCSVTLDNALNSPRITLRMIDRSLFNERNRDYIHAIVRSTCNGVRERRLNNSQKFSTTSVGLFI